jgi:hypothetical protein
MKVEQIINAIEDMVTDEMFRLGLICSACGARTEVAGDYCQSCEEKINPRCGECNEEFTKQERVHEYDESGKQHGELCESCHQRFEAKVDAISLRWALFRRGR